MVLPVGLTGASIGSFLLLLHTSNFWTLPSGVVMHRQDVLEVLHAAHLREIRATHLCCKHGVRPTQAISPVVGLRQGCSLLPKI